MDLYTIGFAHKSAETFFALLREHGVTVLVDTRLHPDTQSSGFARGRDLEFFLRTLSGCDYIHLPILAPTDDMLDEYRRTKGSWEAYEVEFFRLMDERNVAGELDLNWFESNRVCLLSSEHEPDYCYRRLVAEYLAEKWGDVNIIHLV